MAGFLESDLCAPVVEFFSKSGYAARTEVKGCDIALIRGDELVAVELKKSFNITLLYQAIDRQKITEMVYVAIPRPRREAAIRKPELICQKLGLGLLLVAMDSPLRWVEAVLLPNTVKPGDTKARRAFLRELNGRTFDGNLGGQTGKKLMTAYREKSIKIACALEVLGESTAALLKNSFGCDAYSWNILSQNMYGWFEKVKPKYFRLSAQGYAALQEPAYSKFVNYYRQEVAQCMI
ncbi:MAG: DUF2161 family putative PD-(D/E)XK-type phosphodiesterase [Defluviitaleaceae bacterium]|nr:DUF2161 family putative PD-(D/E)XK-type phosphodiesterase [Defluviitaleaceae bacterium]